MKKVLLTLVAACAITTSFAQFYPFAYNNAILQQSAIYQRAYITQVGAYNEARVTQEGKDGISGNTINILQNSYYLTSSENHSITAKQSGSNLATINQLGASTRVDLLQVGYENQFVSNQTGAARTYISATARQTGVDNEAYLTQSNPNNYSIGTVATFTQTGDANLARLTQEGSANGTSLIQQGNSNVIQGLGGINTSALQSGLSNQLSITQKQDYNTVSVSQTGTSNIGVISQSVR